MAHYQFFFCEQFFPTLDPSRCLQIQGCGLQRWGCETGETANAHHKTRSRWRLQTDPMFGFHHLPRAHIKGLAFDGQSLFISETDDSLERIQKLCSTPSQWFWPCLLTGLRNSDAGSWCINKPKCPRPHLTDHYPEKKDLLEDLLTLPARLRHPLNRKHHLVPSDSFEAWLFSSDLLSSLSTALSPGGR